MKIPSTPIILGIAFPVLFLLFGGTWALAYYTSPCHSLAVTDQPGDEPSRLPQDLQVAQAVDQAIINEPSLSSAAHQMKIVTTSDHTVYLLGSIYPSDDLYTIITLAEKNAGGDKIRNHLRVSAEPAAKPLSGVPDAKIAGN